MATLYETLSTDRQLEIAVRVQSPAALAQTFADYAGQFYDRASFDTMARQVSGFYAQQSGEAATCFRNRLDRRLYDRYHTRVAWNVPSIETRHAA